MPVNGLCHQHDSTNPSARDSTTVGTRVNMHLLHYGKVDAVVETVHTHTLAAVSIPNNGNRRPLGLVRALQLFILVVIIFYKPLAGIAAPSPLPQWSLRLNETRS